jgi:hypothetical protein
MTFPLPTPVAYPLLAAPPPSNAQERRDTLPPVSLLASHKEHDMARPRHLDSWTAPLQGRSPLAVHTLHITDQPCPQFAVHRFATGCKGLLAGKGEDKDEEQQA